MSANFDDLLKKILKLSSEDQIRIVNAVNTATQSKRMDEKLHIKFIEERFADGFLCPHCETKGRIVKYGKHRNSDQRYICREYDKTFSLGQKLSMQEVKRILLHGSSFTNVWQIT